MHFERIRFNLCDTLQRVTDLFQARIEQKAIGFCFELSPRTPRHVFGDPLRLSQVLNNLVSNAIKFTDTGQVRVKVDVADSGEGADLLRFSISDTGIGIDANACASLFEAFVQGDASVTRRFGGTGLGLAICKRLVQMMGGTIGVMSELGRGSDFWFTARLEAVDDEHVAEPHASQPVMLGKMASAQERPMNERAEALASLATPLRGVRLLLAEDNLLNQIVAREFLHRAGLEVTVVADGASAVQAVQLAAPGQFAAILMDLHMPVLDGFEATRRIRALPEAEGLPIIGMTAAVLAEDRVRCAEAGMVDHISKPVIPEHLIKALLKWVPAGQLADLDLSSASERLQGNQDLLWRLLETFLVQEADAGRLIADMLARGEVQEARDKVHDLKGGASTVGAKAIAAACADLEAAMASGQHNTEVMLAALQARLTSGFSTIQKCLADRLV
jgi:CheY-like chemotaxis protein/HPt (histidine-containing phosphotransfer) domain-containing protein